ncbi:hypothetical protein [Metabacillus fastidiosus]|uniref:hypothetical protein n=1 Tax=Metabacillus fastidiosus TaxID=1458 RepID=UPI002E210413|nr:hypothetical protein [Metabacillus fastidiosus]
MRNIDRETIQELLKQMGEVARKEAQKNGTYIVYMDELGNTVREYADGKIEIEDCKHINKQKKKGNVK